jgi:hypothetical protein
MRRKENEMDITLFQSHIKDAITRGTLLHENSQSRQRDEDPRTGSVITAIPDILEKAAGEGRATAVVLNILAWPDEDDRQQRARTSPKWRELNEEEIRHPLLKATSNICRAVGLNTRILAKRHESFVHYIIEVALEVSS